MCGIAGIVNRRDSPVSRAELKRMTDIVSHRGPDGEGFYIEANVGLGHRRLAIIDLTEAGVQPMHSADGDLVIVFNGEIYNYLELRDELVALGRTFHSHSDTEVILEAYRVWGQDCVNRLNGMWGFAIYDRRSHLLFCSRDRFGVKPFYYYASADLFVFGSEIKQLLDFVPSRLANHTELGTFLIAGMTDYSTRTFFRDVHKLAAGHNLLVDTRNGRFEIKPYYRLVPVDLEHSTEDEVFSSFAELFKDSIRIRLRSDVAVGTSLSGGLDSSAIATFASRYYHSATDKPFCALTGISPDPATDESNYARLIVEASKLKWIKTRIEFEDFERSLPRLVYHQDEPFPTLSLVMQYHVMQASREHQIPVLLDGQGADETLLGYISYFGFDVLNAWSQNGPSAAFQAFRSAGRQNPELSPLKILRYMASFSNINLKYHLFKRAFRFLHDTPELPEALKQGAATIGDRVEFQKAELFSLKLPALLRYEDRNSMAWSIEARLPFLDYRLVELMVGLPQRFKLREGWTKHILRQTIDKHVPDAIAWRKNQNRLCRSGPAMDWPSQGTDGKKYPGIRFDPRDLGYQFSDTSFTSPDRWAIVASQFCCIMG